MPNGGAATDGGGANDANPDPDRTRSVAFDAVADDYDRTRALDPDTLGAVEKLSAHAAFSMMNPNRVRSLIGAFAQANHTQFNRKDGAGYDFVADAVLELDPKNPQVAARITGAFRSWRALEADRRSRAEATLRRVAGAPSLSRDLHDIVARTLAEI